MSDNDLKFSVLMSLYYKEQPYNLNKCLESLVDQTLLPDEVVIVYDGYIPKNLDVIVDKFTIKLNIKKVLIENNVGLGKALNKGIEFCTYDIVARMDTDDSCIPTRFEVQIPLFADKTLSLAGSGIVEVDELGGKRSKLLPLSFERIKEFSLMKNPFNHMTVVFRKNAIRAVGGYQHHIYMEDYNLWLRMLSNKCNVININEVLVEASVNSKTLKRRRGFTYIKSEFQLFELKRKLNIFPLHKIFYSLVVRVSMRLVPASLLSIFYDLDRGKIK